VDRVAPVVRAEPADARFADRPATVGGVPGRRTVTIQGRGSERYTPERRRPQQRAHERVGFRPDRAAMWAVLLGLLMVLAAATSSHAAVLASNPAVVGLAHSMGSSAQAIATGAHAAAANLLSLR
jgi:hypothetical protein